MQYHLNGYRPGDPDLSQPSPPREAEVLDVLIVGCGPAGLTLAAQLAQHPGIKTRIIERKDGPLDKGQADGVSCRSMEMFQTFGFVEQVMREAYWVNEATFWNPDPAHPERIHRTGRVQDVEDGLSEMPHVILNQARVHDMYLDVMKKAPTRLVPDYHKDLLSLDRAKDGPVTATLRCTKTGKTEQVQTRFVVGCDGARSAVRREIGRELSGDSAHQAWGVMDVLAVTDFPDIRFKSLIQSHDQGSVLVIPREGGYLVRLYVELDKLAPDERVASKDIEVNHLIDAANRIFSPFQIDVKDVVWWSVYEIGHRLTDKFDDAGDAELPRIFIAGDACHTHSPKAGQGMNVSMGDTFNLGWKLIHVLTGRAAPELLHSYSAERQQVAQDLIDFDHEWARIMSAPPQEGVKAPKMQEYFIQHGRYTAGLSVKYTPSALTGEGRWQHLAHGFEVGTRLHSAPVIRVADGKPMHLGHVQRADARWLILAFAAGSTTAQQIASLNPLTTLLSGPNSPAQRATPNQLDPDAIIDTRVILPCMHSDIQAIDLPACFRPTKGKFGLTDYEKIFAHDPRKAHDIYAMRGIDPNLGAIVVVRPDQYVADIIPLHEPQHLVGFFMDVLLAC